MATPPHAESRRLYSWWWDSHIIPKHSKWLQDNLVDMDYKIKAMIRLLEEDADSFARKAEMYYKKRPELIKLVEECFRAYRALAERYDHVTGALRQAHRTIAEAFPNRILLDFFDEYISSEDDAATTQNDACLKKLDQTMGTREDAAGANFAEGGEGKFSEYKLLQKEISRLSNENQDLMKQIALESARADKNESEIQRLKEINSKAKSEKEESLDRYLKSVIRVSDLEAEVSRTKADLQKLTDEIIIGTSFIRSAKERNLDLEKANQLIQLELGAEKKKIQQQEEELNERGHELQILSTSLQDEHQKNVKTEMACQSMENQHLESQEEMRHLKLELKIGVEKLQDMEKELQKIKGENLRLREQKLSSALKIMCLQDEMISLLDLKRKLEDEADFHIEEKEALDLQLNDLKKDRNELERKYSVLTDEMQTVNSGVESSLQALTKDLRDAKLELKDIIKNNEDERNLYLQNLDHMQTMSEKISALEAALLEANDELERLRMKVKELEDSSAYLHRRISIHLAEKAALLSQMEAAAEKVENLSKKNTFLENSLSDMNVELEDLRRKLKGAEESCMSLCDEKSYLLSERSTLISQVENFKQTLQILEGKYCVLENKSSNLEMEKDLMLHQMEEMQELLRVEKKEHSTLLQSSKTQLNALANQIRLLQDQGRQREENAEMEQHQILNTQIEIFILQRCLRDMKEGGLILSGRSQEHQDALQCKEKLILELEQERLTQERNIKSLTDQSNKLRDWIHVIIRTLKMDLEHAFLVDTEDEILLQLIFHEIKRMLHIISESRDEKQHLLLEKSVVVTLLQQLGKYVTDIKAQRVVLESESKIKEQNLALLKCKNDEYLELNELLRNDVQARKQREEALKSEVDLLFRQLKHLQDSNGTLQKENDLLYKKICHLREEKVELEEEHNAILAECMALDCLTVVFRSLNSEREFALRTDFYKVKNNLETDITPIFEKIVMLEVENTHLKESFANLKEQRISLEFQHDANYSKGVNKLSLQRDTGGNPLIKRDIDLVQSILNSKEINLELSRNVNDPEVSDYEATVTRGLEKVTRGLEKVSTAMLNDYANMKVEIESLLQLNNALKYELCEIQKDMGELLHDIQFETINAKVHKEKVLELVRKNENLEICARVQTEVSQEEITLRDSTINELEKKIQILEVENIRWRADLNEYSLFLGSLWDDITILEELTLSLIRRHSTSINQKSEDDQVDSCPAIMSIQEQMKDHSATESVGPLKLQVLHNKVKLLQEVLLNIGSILELERLDSSVSLDAAWREIDGLKLKGTLDNEIVESNYEQFMKDIQLDIVLNPSRFRNFILSHEPRKSKENDAADEQMLDLCGTYEEGCSNINQEGPLVIENNTAHCQIEEVEGKCISDELVTEKELGIDRVELCPKIEPYQEWNRSVIQRLSSDARRLMLLQSSVRDLQKNMEISEMISQPTRLELNTIKVQLKEAEGTISELIEVNGKLTKKVEDFSTSPDDKAEKKDRGSKQQKQISNQAQKVSEKIGRLELEMQKLEYNLLKFEEEHPNKRPRVVKRRPGVRLREYIYGRRNSMRQKEGSSCGCMRAAEISD